MSCPHVDADLLEGEGEGEGEGQEKSNGKEASGGDPAELEGEAEGEEEEEEEVAEGGAEEKDNPAEQSPHVMYSTRLPQCLHIILRFFFFSVLMQQR